MLTISRDLFRFILTFVRTHRIISMFIACALAGSVYWIQGALSDSSADPRYLFGVVEKGTIVASVSGSGQMSALNQLDIKPKASGEIIAVNVAAGQTLTAGQLIAVIDPTDAQKAVRDAEANVQSAQISYDKLTKPADTLSLTQAQHKLSNAQDALAKDYQDTYNDVVATFLDLPEIMTGLEDIAIGTSASHGSQWNIDYYKSATIGYDEHASLYRDNAYNAYLAALDAYDKALVDYKATSQTSDTATIESIGKETYQTAQLIGTALKTMNSYVQFYEDALQAHNKNSSSAADTALTTMNGYITKMNSHISTLLSDTTSIKTDSQAITENSESLANLQSGADALDIQSAQLTLTQRKNALADAQSALANYYVRAPFAGTIAVVNAKKYDTAGSGTALATLITNQQVAELSLNEVDAAKVNMGNKATLTFDAIDGLTLTGKVIEINTIGTVSQGVVSYAVKIGLDTQDERIKSGMTVNASIQTEVHQDVLTVPSGAVKTKNGSSYVEAFSPEVPQSEIEKAGSQGYAADKNPTQVSVQTGISDDTNVEITSGLTEGQQIIIRTITSTTAKTTAAAATSATGARNFGGGGAIRF